jgi:hypothetical protein
MICFLPSLPEDGESSAGFGLALWHHRLVGGDGEWTGLVGVG